MSLKEPSLKMSKSHENQRSRIIITDNPDVIREKVKHALTDSLEGISYDPILRPGVSSLVNILRYLRFEDQTPESVVAEYHTMSLRVFKEMVADAIVDEFASIRARYRELEDSKAMDFLREVSLEGSKRAQKNAQTTLTAVRQAIGF